MIFTAVSADAYNQQVISDRGAQYNITDALSIEGFTRFMYEDFSGPFTPENGNDGNYYIQSEEGRELERVTAYDDNGNRAARIVLLPGDTWRSSHRTELRFHDRVGFRKGAGDYIVKFWWKLDMETESLVNRMDNVLFQLFGDNNRLKFEIHDGKYEARIKGMSTAYVDRDLASGPTDRGKWVRWEIFYRPEDRNDRISVYHNGNLVAHREGDIDRDKEITYFKVGLYAGGKSIEKYVVVDDIEFFHRPK